MSFFVVKRTSPAAMIQQDRGHWLSRLEQCFDIIQGKCTSIDRFAFRTDYCPAIVRAESTPLLCGSVLLDQRGMPAHRGAS